MKHDIEAFREACRRYFNAEGENVNRAFVFYMGATVDLVKPSAETIAWAMEHLEQPDNE